MKIEFDVEELGEVIRMSRAKKRLTQREVAERVGISNPYLSQIELQNFPPSDKVLRGLANVLDLDFDYLLRLTVETKDISQVPKEVKEALDRLSNLRLAEKNIGAISVYTTSETIHFYKNKEGWQISLINPKYALGKRKMKVNKC